MNRWALAGGPLVLLVGALRVGAAAAQQPSIQVRLGGEASSLVGVPFELPVEVDLSERSERLGSFALVLRWNPLVLRLIGGENGNFGPITVNFDPSRPGELRLAGANPNGVGGRVVLGVGRFVALQAKEDTFRLGVTELYAAGSFADLLPQASFGDRIYCPAIGRFGDIDGDRVANSRDALLALTYSVGLRIEGNPALGDVDGDGLTGARDALILLSYSVGLDVRAFRVMRIAPGPCSAGRRPQLSVIPGRVTMDLGQQAVLVAVVRDATGAGMAASDVFWQTTDAAVASVSPGGVVTAVGPGTATIAAVQTGGGRAEATIIVTNRRVHWVNALGFPDGRNQIGAPELPFADLRQALAYARSGDTIMVAPGRYEGELLLPRRLTIIGDTAAGGGLPRLANNGIGPGFGIFVPEGERIELRNLEIEGFGLAVAAERIDTLLLSGLVIRQRPAVCPYGGVAVFGKAGLVMVRGTKLLGDGGSDCAIGVGLFGGAAKLAVEDAVITDFAVGVGALGAESVAVRRSKINDNSFLGIALASSASVVPSPAGSASAGASLVQPVAVAWLVEETQLLRNGYAGLLAEGTRAGRLLRSRIDSYAWFARGLLVRGDSGRGYVTLEDDTIQVSNGWWIHAEALDSAVSNRVRAIGGWGGAFFAVRSARVSRSSIEDLADVASAGIRIEFEDVVGSEGGELLLDSVGVWGARDCGWCADGIIARGARVRANRLLARNLWMAFLVQDSAATVLDSKFEDVRYGVLANTYGGHRPRLRVGRSEFLRARWGVVSYNFATVVDSSAFLDGGDGVGLYGLGADTIRFTKMRRMVSTGVAISQSDTFTVVLDTNAISEVGRYGAAVWLGAGRLLMRGNNVRNNAGHGLWVGAGAGTGRVHRLEGNAFKGNGGYAVLSTYDSVDARGNWWGVDGALPGVSGADSVLGRVNASSPLGSEPGGLLPLAAPLIAAEGGDVRSMRGPEVWAALPAGEAGEPDLRALAAAVGKEVLGENADLAAWESRQQEREARLRAWEKELAEHRAAIEALMEDIRARYGVPAIPVRDGGRRQR
jgi:hypothetical protein